MENSGVLPDKESGGGNDRVKLAILVALSENNLIGVDGDLPWRLSADLKRFKKLTMGHHLIMGRKTYESIGKPLPGRQTIVITRNRSLEYSGTTVVDSIERAVEQVKDDPMPFVVGGGEIYQAFLPIIDIMYVTRVHASLEGDTFFPLIDLAHWDCLESERFSADEKNNHDYTFEVFSRKHHVSRSN